MSDTRSIGGTLYCIL